MGFGWSSYVAQSYMADSCMTAAFSQDQLLTEEEKLPPITQPDASHLFSPVNIIGE